MSPACQAPPQIWLALWDPAALSSACLASLRGATPQAFLSPLQYCGYFGLTCAIEAPFYLAAGRRLRRSYASLLAQTLLLNLATHPCVVFAVPAIAGWADWSYLKSIAVSESFAPLTEALLLKFCARYPWRWALGAALAANLASWWLGAIIV